LCVVSYKSMHCLDVIHIVMADKKLTASVVSSVGTDWLVGLAYNEIRQEVTSDCGYIN
jgi:hypothetical protein